MSYIENYYKNKETRKDECQKFFNGFESEEKIKDSKKEINRLNKLLEEEKAKCTKLMTSRYNKNYTPVDKPVVLVYNGKSSTVYFDISTGTAIDEPAAGSVYTYQAELKNGDINVITGYCFELGAVVRRHYKYAISTDNKKVRLILDKEEIVPIIDDNRCYYVFTNYSETGEVFEKVEDYENWYYRDKNKSGLGTIDATYFLNNMYGLENESYGSLTLKDVSDYSKKNKAFETIIKTSRPDYIVKLMSMNFDKNAPINKLLGLSEEEYQKSVNDGTVNVYIDFKKFLTDTIGLERLERANLDVKTDADWLEYLEKCKTWEEDLDFYSVGYESNLANLLIKAYCSRDYYYHCDNISEYYKFGKFCKYVIDETINQGYNSIRSFASELHDYIEMCKDLDVKPTLYSSYLHQTHDITSRNHKIKLEKDQEEIFLKRYQTFKPYKKDVYSIIAPEKPLDVQKEGDQMNNCVASYLKRIIDGTCLILFLRHTENLVRSLVTLEIRDGALVQAKQSHNNRITAEQETFLKKFCEDRKLEYRA